MKAKLKKIFFTSSCCLLLATSSVIVSPILVSCNEESSNNSTNNSNNNPSSTNNETVIDNINELKKTINYSNLITFNPSTNPLWKPWYQLNDDVNNKIYSDIFNKINNSLITNDLKMFICDIAETNNTFAKINVKSFDVSNINDKYITKIFFKIQNTNNIDREFKIRALDNFKILVKSNEIMNFEIDFNTSITKYFFKTKILNLNNTYNLFASYSFNSVNLKINDKVQTFNNVATSIYSKTLNTEIKNVNIANTYNTIKTQGDNFLNSLTINEITQDINNTIKQKIDLVKLNIDDIQTILQSMILNEPLKTFLINNSNSIANLITNNIKTTSFDLVLIKPIIVQILENKTIIEIFNNNQNVEIINNIINLLPEQIQPIIQSMVQKLSSEQGINEIIAMLNQEPFLSIVGNELINNLNQLKTMGILEFLCTNIDLIKDLLTRLNINVNNEIMQFYPLIKLISNDYLNSNKGIIDDLIELINAKDSNNQNYLRTLIQLFIKNPTIINLLDQIIFNNNKVNTINLINLISAFANPYSSITEPRTVIKYIDWLNSLEIQNTLDQNNKYDNSNYLLKFIANIKYIFKQDIYFDLSKVYPILPNSLTINNVSIPISVLSTFLPTWFGLKTNDYIAYNININNNINYAINKINDINYFTWNAISNSTLDINMPGSLEIVTNYSNLPTKTAISLLNNIFYHEYKINDIIHPTKTNTNWTIDTYNYQSYNNQAILLNSITDTRKKEIKDEIIKASTNTTLPNQSYQWTQLNTNKKYNVSKTITNSSYNLSETLINELFDFSNFNSNYQWSIEINQIIPKTTIMFLFTIPEIYEITIKVFSNNNFYDGINHYPVQEIKLSL